VVLLHRPQKLPESALYISTAKGDGSPPSVLYVPGEPDGTEALLCVQTTPMAPRPPDAPPLGTCKLSMLAFDWKTGAEEESLVTLPCDGVSCVPLTLQRGKPYSLSVVTQLPEGYTPPPPPSPPEADEPEEAPDGGEPPAPAEPAEPAMPPPAECVWSVSAACPTPLFLGKAVDVAKEHLQLAVSTLDGTLPAVPAGTWAVGLAVSIKLTTPTTLAASLRLKDAPAAACGRLHLVDEDTYEARSWGALASGAVELEPNVNGYTLLLDLKHTADLAPSDWSLEVLSTAEVPLAAEAAQTLRAWPADAAYPNRLRLPAQTLRAWPACPPPLTPPAQTLRPA